jgi:hypothetical protein
MEGALHTIGVIIGITIIAWFPLTFFTGLFLRTELKPEARKARYWAFPLLIRPEQLSPFGVKLRTIHRRLLVGGFAVWAVAFALGLLLG